jgi:hypothetical protein
MKTNKLTISAIALAITFAVSAQTSFDAAKLYDEELNGTARYVAMGGAMGAFGSDISVISHNPAGIGTYRKSDINFSLSGFGTSVNTDPMATKASPIFSNGRTYYSHNSKSDFNMALDNFSAVLSGSDAGNTYVNFGFSYRKLQNMDRNLDYVDAFYDADGYEVWREYQDYQRNKTNSFDFNVSLNFSDKLYLGWTLGLLSTNIGTDGYFFDYYDASANHPDYPKGLDYTAVERMNQSDGSGWNMAFGTIIRPIPALRLGAAIKTPTYYRQKLEYADYLYAFEGTQFRTVYDNVERKNVAVTYTKEEVSAMQLGGSDVPGEVEKFTDEVDYKFTSPWSLDLSAGVTFGGPAFSMALGAEYEKHFTQRTSLSIGYTKLESQGAIDYKDYSVIKLGTELNFGNISVRGGYNFRESMMNDASYPYLFDTSFNGWEKDDNGKVSKVGRSDFQIDRLGKTQYITGGLGYCSAPDRDGTQFYIDLAYVHGIRNSIVNVNEYVEDVDVNYNYKSDKVMFTIGWNF